MLDKIIRDYDGLVTISWNEALESICLKWHTEHDTEGRVIEAVKYALSYVAENRIKHWWVDLSTSKEGLTDSDQQWVQSEFGLLIAESTLTKLAMTPPRPETGQDTAWIDDWEKDTNEKYKGKIMARLVKEESEIREFFKNH